MPIWTHRELNRVEGHLLDHCVAVRSSEHAPLDMTTAEVTRAVRWDEELEIQIALTRLSKRGDGLVKQLAEKEWRIGGMMESSSEPNETKSNCKRINNDLPVRPNSGHHWYVIDGSTQHKYLPIVNNIECTDEPGVPHRE